MSFTSKARKVAAFPREHAVVITVVLSLVTFLGWAYLNFIRRDQTCEARAELREDVISRLAFLGELKQGTYNPQSQELFYEAVASVSSTEPLESLSIELSRLGDSDIISVFPPSGIVSEPKPGYFSGFAEPGRAQPDYWIRFVTFPATSPGSPAATVTIRRSLDSPAVSDTQQIRLEAVTAKGCTVTLTGPQGPVDLSAHARSLFEKIYGMSQDGPVPLTTAPQEPGRGGFLAFVWVRCEDSSCTSMRLTRMKARIGETEKQAQTQRFHELAAEAKRILGCIEGPQKEVHPDRTVEYFEMCGGPIQLEPDQMEQLFEAMQRAGADIQLCCEPTDEPAEQE